MTNTTTPPATGTTTPDATTVEIEAIRSDVVNYQTGVTSKIQTLEAELNAQPGGLSASAQAALDDLKSFADNLQVPA